MPSLPRFTAALFLGTLVGVAAATLYGAWLVHDARADQLARSQRLHDLGAVAVPHPDLVRGLTWRDDLAAGLFYGLTAGWPLGGVLSLLAIGLGARSRSTALGLAALLVVAVAAGAEPDDRAAAAVWMLGLAALMIAAWCLKGWRPVRAAFLLALGLVLAVRLWDPLAALPTAAFAMALPWAVALASGLFRRTEAAT